MVVLILFPCIDTFFQNFMKYYYFHIIWAERSPPVYVRHLTRALRITMNSLPFEGPVLYHSSGG